MSSGPGKALGIKAEDFAWHQDAHGLEFPFHGLQLSPEQLAKVGQLHLQLGRSGEQQVVPATWVAVATQPHVKQTAYGAGYGYLWWVGEGGSSYWAMGYGGQHLAVLPKVHRVLAVLVDEAGDAERVAWTLERIAEAAPASSESEAPEGAVAVQAASVPAAPLMAPEVPGEVEGEALPDPYTSCATLLSLAWL